MKSIKAWKPGQLSDLAKIVRGSSPRPAGDPKYFNGSHLPWVTVAEVTKDKGMYLRSTASSLTKDGSAKTRILNAGTLLLTNSGATLGVPKILMIRAGANDGIAAFLNLNADREFLYYFLQSRTRYMRERVAPGVGQPNLNTELIGLVPLAIPPRDEQIRIAKVLSTWDEALEKLDALIQAKEQRKKALMQQLLTGKKRLKGFDGEWVKTPLFELIDEQPRATKKPATQFLSAGLKSHGKGVFLKPNFNPADIALKELYQIREGDLVVNITFAWEGALAIVPNHADGALTSHRFLTFTTRRDCAHMPYLGHVIKTSRFVFDCGLASPGGAGRNRVLSKKEFLKISINLPPLPEQKAVANLLDSCDEELHILRKQRAAIDHQKRGLMQRLLTGKVRVKV